ncbi:hypothetical protein [Streptomyces sp. XD-27]|uniref:hypothetical protein n=1 Tax=Streptomyces sp. XD-27 TaxID=3062779 RepID=UPI0026F436B3|nr:hypothetical protein [Streptomyces sp. XD-27]WKX73351.1 hypothetical protein Q3Y56_28730 [Streptomyces sp. XD-27]
MTTLMTYAGPVDAAALVTRTGGVPLTPAGFSWPRCATCAGAMQFLAQLLLDDLVLAVFMCQNDPGMCDDWDPASGGNRALLFPRGGLAAAPVPDRGATLLSEVCGIAYATVDEADYDKARDQWCATHDRDVLEVLGRFGGAPSWLQGDETPPCPSCARPMAFAAQLEEGHDHRTAMNFGGGGCGYAFTCAPCLAAAFLWQC